MVKCLYFIFLTVTFAQVSDYAYTGAEASAMVGAVVSERGGSWSAFYNPAGMTEIDGTHFSIGSGKLYGYNWLPTYNLSGYVSLPLLGTIGLSLQQLETKSDGIALSTEQTLSIAQGFDLQHDNNSHLSIGYTANLIQWDLGKSAGVSGNGSDGWELGSIDAITVDFGILASLREKYRFGVFMKNINSGALGKGMTRQVLPRRINTGITYLPMTRLSTSIVSEQQIGRDNLQIKCAIQYILNSNIIIYAGAQSNPNRFGIGATVISLNNQSISYGLLSHPVLPMTHQLNIGISL